jgi:exodeoxyribonuclease VII large subunit
LHTQQLACAGLVNRLERGVFNSLQRRQLALQPLSMRLRQAAASVPRLMSHRLDKSEWLLRSLDPALVLKRGYAWLQNKQGHALVSVKEFESGQQVIARLSDGQVDLTVNTSKKI